jgi:hypothetical protein
MESTSAVASSACQWRGAIHGAKCPLVKAIEYEHGMVKRVEFFAPNDYAPKLADWPAAIPPGQFGPAYSYSIKGVATCGGVGADEGSARLV